MIPLKNFDDKRFLELLEEARSLIHRYSDEWTDENYHDPGITFLEMLTWLTEMQRFYLSRISDVSMNQLIELMGYLKKGSQPARGIVQLRSMGECVFLPSYTQLKAAEQVFETAAPMDVVNSDIQHILNVSGQEIQDQTQQNNQQGMHYLPFGQAVEAGESWVLLLDKPLPMGKIVQIYIDVYDGYAIKLKETCSKKHGIVFDILGGLSEEAPPLVLEKDETLGFMRPGLIRFKTPKGHEKIRIGDLEGYPIVFRIKENYDLLSPQFNNVFINGATCLNVDHQVQCVAMTGGERLLQFELALIGHHLLQKKIGDHWQDVPPTEYDLRETPMGVLVDIKESGNYQMIFWRQSLGKQSVIGSTTGFPDGMIRFVTRNAIVENMVVTCGVKSNQDFNWLAYAYTDSFLKHDKKARVFSVDPDHEFILFGNHEHGYLPEAGQRNLRLLQLQLSNFERGNIKAGRLQAFARESLNNVLRVTNPYDFSGGRRKESKEKVLQDLLSTYAHKESLVTADDYLEAVKGYPDARILYANAYGDELSDNRIKVTAVPYTGQRFPKISQTLKNGLMAYLDQYRMITTAIEFIDPVYIEAGVYVDLIIDQPRLFKAEKVQAILYELFNPLQGYEVDIQYKMGTVPSKSDVMARLLKIEGVGGIKRLEIEISGGQMPKHGLVYSDRIQLNYE